MAPINEPVLFLWSFSPWASKVTAYLALRNIPHTRCEQPITLPRPSLAALGLKYRRIPVLTLGRDIYCDTLLILSKLEKLYPETDDTHKRIGAQNGTELALEKLFEKWTDVVVFKPAAAAIPSDLDLMKDPTFQKDREELWGRSWTKDGQEQLRPAALANLRENFDFLEAVLSDGRAWILGDGDGPRLADIHACWIFDWLLQLPGAFPEDFFNDQQYPKTFAWRDRYNAAVAKAKERAPKPTELSGPDAVSKILGSGFEEDGLEVKADPSGLQQGQEVEMYPVDTGFNYRDSGKLVGLSRSEAVVRTVSMQDGKEMRVHYPRWNFIIGSVPGTNGTKHKV